MYYIIFSINWDTKNTRILCAFAIRKNSAVTIPTWIVILLTDSNKRKNKY